MTLSRKCLKTKIGYLLLLFLLWTVVFVLQKPVFLIAYAGGLSQVLPVVWHGLPLDFSLAGYLTAVPALLLLVSSVPLRVLHTEGGRRMFKSIHYVWTIIASVLVALSFVANCALYDYWRFPLDSTPIFFITSSPADAMASVYWWQALGGVVGVAIVAWAIFWLFKALHKRFADVAYEPVSIWHGLVMLVVVAALFIPIRGGFSVASMNTGRVYYSDDQTLNHAAVNPMFSFLESMSHQKDFGSQYRYMDDKLAHKLAATMMPVDVKRSGEPRVSLLKDSKPDIYIIIMESFSDTLTKQPGVTPKLNSLKREGVYFSRFYANSYRTDRGLLSILYGFPSPATVSLMKYPKLTAKIPSLPEKLTKAGWALNYYYGGDADFTNMRSFLVNQGFKKITEDINFPITDRLSKWGVPDHLLFRRVEKDLTADRSSGPVLRVIQTSSSHEPFDVPFHRFADKRLNAFAYADSCVGSFVDYLKTSGRWEKSLVIMLPDHLGAWPEDLDNMAPWRFHIPMIWTGGAVKAPMVVTTYGSQQDIAATLLAQLGLSSEGLRFSKDMMNPASPHFAFFMMNDGFGLVDDDNTLVFDNKQQRTVVDLGHRKGKNLRPGQAYVQTIFDYIASKQ